MSDEAKLFEGWAILELMGHRRLGGFVSEVEIAGHGFLRLDIPESLDGVRRIDGVTQFYAPGSVYALTPTTEETARLVRSRPEPVHPFEIPRAALPPGAHEPSSFGDDVVDNHDDDDINF